ncbi:MAG: tRNA-dihydrouridine synthase family protein [Bacteroidales bacterium]|nr:tRNA-dihydrouridine synthase family protein [Bacteroidales bacterium]
MSSPLPIHFAPMQGYTDAPYRNAHAALFGGIAAYYTPFIRLERGTFRTRDVRNADLTQNTGQHLIPQLIARDAHEARTIVDKLTEMGHTEVDINMGCPYPMITNRGRGAAILANPQQVADVLNVVREHSSIGFSLKMRLGMEQPNECMTLLPIINDTPLRHVTMHPRVAGQLYDGKCNLDAFACFAEGCQHPIIYNGDIATIADIQRVAEQFPWLAGVMIGRGLLSNPALAMEYAAGQALAPDELLRRIRQMHQQLLDHYSATLNGDAQVLAKMRPFWEYLLPEGNRKSKKRIARTTSLSAYKVAVAEMLRG